MGESKGVGYYLVVAVLIVLILGMIGYTLYLIDQRYQQPSFSKRGGSPAWTPVNASKEDLPITYAVNETACGELMSGRFDKAFAQLTSETMGIVTFQKVEGSANIKIMCYLEAMEEGEYFTSAHATLGKQGKKIDGATMVFYNVDPIGNARFSGGCLSYPNTELHELLHVFGYIHNEKEGSIMNPISPGCRVLKVDEKIIEDLKKFYAEAS